MFVLGYYDCSGYEPIDVTIQLIAASEDKEALERYRAELEKDSRTYDRLREQYQEEMFKQLEALGVDKHDVYKVYRDLLECGKIRSWENLRNKYRNVEFPKIEIPYEAPFPYYVEHEPRVHWKSGLMIEEVVTLDTKDNRKKYQVWQEGFLCTGMEGVPARACYLGSAEAVSFKEACDIVCKDNPNYDSKTLRIWGCRLYDNEKDARESFG